MAKPLIVLNFKAYEESLGEKAVRLAQAAERVGKERGVEVVVCPQPLDLHRVASKVSIPVYAQHVDGVASGAHTGHVTAKAVREAGARGTLLNHSERRLRTDELDAAVKEARAAGLGVIICANTPAASRAVAGLEPDYVAIEPPELIGSGIPVSKSKPEVVKSAVEAARAGSPRVGVLCGAGISKAEDVRAALSLGTAGVLLASGVVKAPDPEKALRELIP